MKQLHANMCAQHAPEKEFYMKRIIVLCAACLLITPVMAQAEEKAKPTLDTFEKKLSYAMGADVGKYFRGLGKDIDFETLVFGITDGYTEAELALNQEEIVMVQQEFGARLQAKKAAELEAMKEKNLAAGKTFLEENKMKEGVIVTESGLQYEFITKGDGPMPNIDDQVKVDYVGTLVDGTEFDSSIKRGEPVVFGVNQVIPGWSEALKLLPVGSKARLVIPSHLAYGEQGVMPKIEPNSVLVFEVTLHAIEGEQEEAKPEDEKKAVEEAKPASEDKKE
jgi:FKBP-type peptidyl-prolyl cis-trans isomerase